MSSPIATATEVGDALASYLLLDAGTCWYWQLRQNASLDVHEALRYPQKCYSSRTSTADYACRILPQRACALASGRLAMLVNKYSQSHALGLATDKWKAYSNTDQPAAPCRRPTESNTM
jgi:hypothetical protein